jgi:hypothetical protein
MIDAALVVLQNPTDSEKVQGPCSEISSASSREAYQAIATEAEEVSAAEEEEGPIPITFPGIKVESEVSCLSVSMLNGLHKYRCPLFYACSIYKLLLQ